MNIRKNRKVNALDVYFFIYFKVQTCIFKNIL